MNRPTPDPSPLILRAAWIMARAFSPNRVVAACAYPWAVLSILPGTIRRGLYLDDTRTGMVLLYRSRLLLDLLLITPLILVVAIAYPTLVLPTAITVLGVPGTLIAHLLAFGVAITGLVPLMPGSGASMLPWGKETPTGQRWEIAGLAQLPGTRLTATQLAHHALATVPPPGAVIVATAGTQALQERYVRAGFTVGPQRRVHRVIGAAPIDSSCPSRAGER